MLETDPRTEYTLAIDTDAYAGNFERALFGFITGLCHNPDEKPRGLEEPDIKAGQLALGLDPARLDSFPDDHPLYQLLDVRISDPGDDGYHRSYIDIVPTPGYWNDGHGNHYPDTVKPKRKGKLYQGHPWPAYYSIGLYLRRPPTAEELELIKGRALLWAASPPAREGQKKPTITGFRLLCATTTTMSTPLYWCAEKSIPTTFIHRRVASPRPRAWLTWSATSRSTPSFESKRSIETTSSSR